MLGQLPTPGVTNPLLAPVLQNGLGPLASPLGVLGVLVVLALIILVGRFVMKVAWRLVVVAIVVVGTLYVLSLLGFAVGPL